MLCRVIARTVLDLLASQQLFQRQSPRWSSTDLYNAVVINEETDWSVFNHGRPITKFTQMLGDFGIKPTKRSNANVFYVVDLEDAFVRYLTHLEISSSSTCSVVEGCGGCGGFRDI